MKKKAYCYKINLHFLFLTAICHKGRKFLEIWGFFSIFFVGTNFHDFEQKPRKVRKLIPAKISTTKYLFWFNWPVLIDNSVVHFYSAYPSFVYTLKEEKYLPRFQ